MAPDTQQKLLALLKPLFAVGATLRALEGTEPDDSGGELYRIRIDWANDAINLLRGSSLTIIGTVPQAFRRNRRNSLPRS